jgi:tetraacyldisaccharide 4'-kinase
MQLMPASVKSLENNTESSVDDFLEMFGEFNIYAFAGIGNPQRFFSMLQALGFNAESQAFADHHNYTKQDFTSVADGTVMLMTEKDAVKCRSLGLKNAWYVPVEAQMPEEFERILRLEIAKLIKDRQS